MTNIILTDQLSRKGKSVLCPGAIIIKNGCILVGYRHYTSDKWKNISVWTIPGGRSDEGETIGEALHREVKEEVGIEALTVKDFIGEVPGAKEGDIVPLFYCSTDEEPRLMEPEKFSEWKWMPLSEFSDPGLKFINPAVKKVVLDYLVISGREA